MTRTKGSAPAARRAGPQRAAPRAEKSPAWLRVHPPPLPAPVRILAALATAAALVALVSFPISDPDLWQHLRTGRAIWETGTLEPRNVWTWPGYGEPYVIPSWLFRVVLWPFYSVGGLAGLFVWRWITTLACFGLLWAASRSARRPGSTGLAALCVLMWCGVLYRYRSQVRPEMLVAVLLAAQLWILEWRRAQRAPSRIDPAWWLVPISVVWINVHLSYVLGLLVTGAYLLDELWHARGIARGGLGPAPGTRRSRVRPGMLALVLGASAAASFLNPYGLGLVRQPFDFLGERNQLVFRMIAELGPVPWRPYLVTGLPLLVALPPLLALWRWRRSGPDLAQLAIYAAFIPQGLSTQRFIGYTAVAIAPFFARDAGEFFATRRWPAWLVRPAVRVPVAVALAAVLLVPALDGPAARPAIALRESAFPSGACDAIAAMNVRGRSFSLFSHGGYLIWRFWPERDRLPFTDIHATGSPELREAYARALVDSAAWERLDARWRFDWVLLPRAGIARGPLLETLDADTARWALVFLDDVAAVYVRRDGASGAVAARAGYAWLPAGTRRLPAAVAAFGSDSLARAGLLAELERAARESKQSASLQMLRGDFALAQGQPADALTRFDAALATGQNPPGVQLRRGMALIGLERPADALVALRIARRDGNHPEQVEALMGRAHRSLGQVNEARAAWRRALALDPSLPGLADSLAALDRDGR